MSFVTPAEVFEAINHAHNSNSSDEFGDTAFQVDDVYRTSKGVTFRNYKILKFDGKKWTYVPLKLRFVSLPIKARLVKNGEFKKAQLQFTKSSSSAICGEYGKAKCAIYDAFK